MVAPEAQIPPDPLAMVQLWGSWLPSLSTPLPIATFCLISIVSGLS